MPAPSISRDAETVACRSRRAFLRAGVGAACGAALARSACYGSNLTPAREVLPVAAVVTVYQRGSHADVLVGKILEGFRQDGGRGPDLKLVSLVTDQVPTQDLSRGLAAKYGFRLANTIDEAITLGTNRVQVAGVLSIGEHGDYPSTPDTKQHMYPRRRFFEEIVAAFRRCDQVVPVFNDKHLSYRWDDARFMVDTARALGIPFLAGSSLPVAWRYPPLELPRDCPLESALTVAYGGYEAYGFHALETHQCMIERRRGGETGVVAVQAVTKDGIRQAAAEGLWSTELFVEVLNRLPGAPRDDHQWDRRDGTAVYLLTHRDGMKSAVVMASGLTNHFGFAAKLQGKSEPLSTWFKLEEGAPYGHFAYLLRAIEESVHRRAAVYPVERTLLTTGILDRVMQSLAKGGLRIETPELNVAYQAANWPFANDPLSTLQDPGK